MNQILLLTANIILYLVLLFVHFIFQNSFNKKIENFRVEGAKALDMFRDELLKKTRRFELKYEIFKGFSWNYSQVHWLITRIDWGKVFECFENLYYQGILVSNFYGQDVQEKLTAFGNKLSEITDKRNSLDSEFQKLSMEKAEVEEQKKYLNIISSVEARDYKELYERISLETRIKLKDEAIFEKQTEIISKIIKEIQDAFKEVYTLGQSVLIAMASELKDEYKI